MSPTINPLVEPQEIQTRRRLVKSGRDDVLASTTTGEITHASRIYTIEEKDDAEFVKVFAAGITAAYDLTKTAQRVFSVVLDRYQQTPMHNGYADSIELYWFGDGLDGDKVGIAKATFYRGLKELLDKRFIAPKTPTSYWVNPALFFKGDRVMFITEYRKRHRNKRPQNEALHQTPKQTTARHNQARTGTPRYDPLGLPIPTPAQPPLPQTGGEQDHSTNE